MNLKRLRQFQVSPRQHRYDWRDTVLYALGLGYGANPMDETELRFVYEKELIAVPSMCNVIGHPPFWLNAPELEVDWVKMLHAEQSFVVHKPLPPAGEMRSSFRIFSVEDKGADKGAIMSLEKRLHGLNTDEVYCSVVTSVFLRGDGGQGGFGEPPSPASPIPDVEPTLIVDLPTLPQSALIYRLNGDTNPLHAEPAIARKAGFRQPILHGLATMGMATRALLRSLCDNDPTRLRSMFVRFTSPVYPGETIRTEVYEHAGFLRFRCRVVERDIVVLDRGTATVGPAM